MRRLFTIITALVICLVGVPAQAAAVEPLGSGAVLFNPLGPANRQCTAAFAASDGTNGYLVAGPSAPAAPSTAPPPTAAWSSWDRW